MENNVNFSKDLGVCFLSLLAKYDHSSEFVKAYEDVGSYLADTVDMTTDMDMLERLKGIIEYKKAVEKGMSK